MTRIVGYWAPAVLWTGGILVAASDLFASRHTGSLFGRILGELLSAEALAVLHFAVRKVAHFVVYAILAALWFRALRVSGVARAALVACGVALVVAIADETLQSRVSTRSGQASDVLIDLAGAATAAAVGRMRHSPPQRRPNR